MLQLIGFTCKLKVMHHLCTTHNDICKGFNWHCRAYLCLLICLVEIYICSQPYFLGSQGHVPSVHNPHLLFLQPTMISARVSIDIAELISVSSYVACGDLHLFFSSSILSFGLRRSCTICAQPTFVVFTIHNNDICKGFNWHCRAYLCLFICLMWRSTSVLQFLLWYFAAARTHKVMCHLCTTHINFCCFFLQHTVRSAYLCLFHTDIWRFTHESVKLQTQSSWAT